MDKEFDKSLGEALRKKRQEKNLSMEYVAQHLGVTKKENKKTAPGNTAEGCQKKEDMREKECLIKKTVLLHALLVAVLDVFLRHYRLAVGEVLMLVTVTVIDLYVFKDVVKVFL